MTSNHSIARISRRGRATAGICYEVILLNTVSKQIEVLTLRLLLRLVLLKNVEALLLLKRLVTHFFETLAAAVYHVNCTVLVARMVGRNPLIIRRLRPRALPLLAHRTLHQRILRNLTFSDEHPARIADHVAAFASSCDGHACAVYLLLQKLILRVVCHNLLLLVLFVS